MGRRKSTRSKRETYDEAATRLWRDIILREVSDSQFAQYDSEQTMLDDFRSLLWGEKAKARGRTPPPYNPGFETITDRLAEKAFTEKKHLLKFSDFWREERRFRIARDNYERLYKDTLKKRLKLMAKKAYPRKKIKRLMQLHEKEKQKRRKELLALRKITRAKLELERTKQERRILPMRRKIIRRIPVRTKLGIAAQLKTPKTMRTIEKIKTTKQLRAKPKKPPILKRKTRLTGTAQLLYELKKLENRKSRLKPLSVYKRGKNFGSKHTSFV